MNDRETVAAQLDRRPRSPVEVVARCHLEMPVVIAVPPFLDDGTPFPTRYWLTCPLAVRRIGRVEGTGGVKAAEAAIEGDAELRAHHQAATDRYTRDRDSLIPDGTQGPRPRGGVGGARIGVKCLHAHYADHAAGNDNPIGAWTAPSVEPLNCTVACVAPADGAAARNPDWREPPR